MIKQIAIRGFDKNFSYFVGDGVGKSIGIVDPGDTDHLIAAINHEELEPVAILVTHSHFDHVEGIERLLEDYEIPVYMHQKAEGRVPAAGKLAQYVQDGDEIEIGKLVLKVMHTPGHIDDAVCYFSEMDRALITGDTLFVEGCGRADLEGANVEDLWQSLQRIATMDEDIKIYPGHDYGSKPVSTVGWEKKRNRFLRCEDLESFRRVRMP